MLLALATAFALSQAWRTVAAIMATPLAAEFHLSAQSLGLFAGAFHFAFGAMQLFMGIGIDLHGVRRTVLLAFPIAIAGSLLSALASSYSALIWGQILIGIGCAPAFLVCTVFIARHFPPGRFAAISGITLGLGGVGMLLTGTPLAWLVQASSWRFGFVLLAVLAALSWLLIWYLVHEPEDELLELNQPLNSNLAKPARESLSQALRGFGALFLMPHTWGIVLLASVSYAAFITLRGLWLGPLLIERLDFSLVQSGHVALVMSLASLIGSPLFGRLDPGAGRRRRWILCFSFAVAALFGLFAFSHHLLIDMLVPVLIGLLSGYIVLQYADVRSAYPAAITGRAMAMLTMAMFLGVALMQWLTGAIASAAIRNDWEPYSAVLASIAVLLAAGAVGFAWLPGPPRLPEAT